MPAILIYILKMSISLAAVYIFYFLLLRQMTFYQWNRWYLLVYAIMCFVLPFMDIYWWLDSSPQDISFLQYMPAIGDFPATETALQENLLYNWNWLTVLIGVGVGVMFVRLLIQYASLLKMHSRAKLFVNGNVRLYEVKDAIVPFSFGSAVYINPSQHEESELKEIIRHEMVHVRQHHTIDVILSELLVVLCWFNPFAWLLRKAIRQNLEFIADRQVLVNGVDRTQYQYLLLKVVGQRHFSMASHLNISALKNRIAMMNKIRTARLHLVKFAFAVPVIAVLLLAFRKQDDSKQENKVEGMTALNFFNPGFTLNDGMFESGTDTVPGKKRVWKNGLNEKGYYVTIADNHGECIVIVKDNNKKLIKAVQLTEWNASKSYEAQYGEIPPPPPPAPAAPPAPPAVKGQIAPPAPPAPPALPNLPDNVSTLDISDKKATIRLKDGTLERYDLESPKDRSSFEKKYGPLPEAPEKPDQTDNTIYQTNQNNQEPMVIAGNRKMTMSMLRQIPSSQIESMNVLKGKTATDKYGQQGQFGVIEVSLREEGDIPAGVLYIVDGKEATREQVNALSNDEIREMKVLKGDAAVEKYGEKGRNGVVEIYKQKVIRVELWNPLSMMNKKDNC
ncbi:hypothetical protein MD537_01245 [Flavihumibacter sediminis]|nr:hypothetical protein [Flavihumibacter sediminis]